MLAHKLSNIFPMDKTVLTSLPPWCCRHLSAPSGGCPVCLQKGNNVASTLSQADWYFSGPVNGVHMEFEILLGGADHRHYGGCTEPSIPSKF